MKPSLAKPGKRPYSSLHRFSSADALMLVQHAGLNPMGKRCRAGCPIANLQATLDSLTAAGLSVAVYEEFAPSADVKGSGGSKLKYTRALTQVVSPASL